MIAIPIQKEDENPAFVQLFGKARFFIFIKEDGSRQVEANSLLNGVKLVEYFAQKGVKKLIVNHIGKQPLLSLQNTNIECFYTQSIRKTVNELLEDLENNKLEKITDENINIFLENKRQCRHSH